MDIEVLPPLMLKPSDSKESHFVVVPPDDDSQHVLTVPSPTDGYAIKWRMNGPHRQLLTTDVTSLLEAMKPDHGMIDDHFGEI